MLLARRRLLEWVAGLAALAGAGGLLNACAVQDNSSGGTSSDSATGDSTSDDSSSGDDTSSGSSSDDGSGGDDTTGDSTSGTDASGDGDSDDTTSGDTTSGDSTSGDGTDGGGSNELCGVVSSNHGHTACLSEEALIASAGVSLFFTGGHTHTLILTAQQVQDADNSITVATTSTETNGHTHLVTFNP